MDRAAWRTLAGAAIVAGPTLAIHAEAQELPSTVFEQQDLLRRPGIVDPLINPTDALDRPVGVSLGRFVAFPSVDIGALANSNVFADKRDIGDAAAMVATDLRLRSRERDLLRLDAYVHGDYSAYAQRTTENAFQLQGGADVAYQIAPATQLRGSVEGGRFVEDRAVSFTPVPSRSPLKYNRFNGTLGITYTPGRLILSPTLEIDRLAAFDNEVAGQPGVVLNNGNRSYTRINPQLIAGYAISPVTSVFGGVEYNRRDYDRARVPSRDSTGYAIYGGVRFRPSELTRLDLAAGYIRQNYELPLTDPHGAYLRGSFLWSPTRLTRIKVDVRRDVSETGALAVGGALRTRYKAEVEHDLTRGVRFDAGAELRHYNFAAIDRTDDRWFLTAGAAANISRRLALFVRGEQVFSRTAGSESPQFEYSRTRLLAGLQLKR